MSGRQLACVLVVIWAATGMMVLATHEPIMVIGAVVCTLMAGFFRRD